MASNEKYTWTSFYTEFADKLLAYKERRSELIEKIQGVYRGLGIPMPRLDSTDVPADIDPYTVFGLFNKGISTANRRKVFSAIAESFEVKTNLPEDFEGVPLLNNLNATFYAFVGDARRGERDIDNLWRIFEAQIELAAKNNEQNRAAFVQAYDACLGKFGRGWKLTMGLYWVRPHDFINLDSRNRWYLGDMAKAGQQIAGIVPHEKDTHAFGGSEYLAVCNAINSRLDTNECPFLSFPELSAAAFAESERVNREKKAAEKAAEKEAEENSLGDAGVETVRCWLYSPGERARMWEDFRTRSIMGIGWSELGDLAAYSSKEEMRTRLCELRDGNSSQRNSALACWQFVHEMKPGDLVFAKRGVKEVVGLGVVDGEYRYDAGGAEYPNLRKVDWTDVGARTFDGNLESKTLTDVTDYTGLVDSLLRLFPEIADELGEEATAVEEVPEADFPPYGKEEFLAEVFMDEDSYDTLAGVLRAKKNVILQGAPGVGKTFVAKRLAYSMMGEKDAERVMMVQFHQSYSYEDFVEGYRPSSSGFELAKGSFYAFCKAAAEDEERDYFFIIDEINRGNLSKIFGELFMLVENDKRGPKNKLRLLYSHELFYVPSNVYLIGMMNTADRSLALLDYALRRRFAFFDLKPGFSSEGFVSYCKGIGSPKLDNLVACVELLNKDIAADETLGEGFCIGHSYFCGMRSGSIDEGRLSAIVEYELVPLLCEYWFDEPSKVREWADALRKAIA